MSTIDNYGIQYGTGELFPKNNEGGTTDPANVTKRRTKGNASSFVSSSTGGTELPAGNQDLLNAIQMGNLGTGVGIYSRRESNTFYFKSLVAGNGIELTSTPESIMISATGSAGGPGSISTEDTPSVDLEGDGLSTTPLKATVKISAEDGNILVENADGLFVPEGTNGGPSTLTVDDTETVRLSLISDELTAFVLISDEPDNALEVKIDGLYVPPGGADGQDGAPGPMGPAGPQGLTGAQGETGPAGIDGEDGKSLEFKGAVPTAAQLPLTADEGDAWLAESHIWIWTNGAFVDGGKVEGEQGPIGLTGQKGAPGETGTAPNLKGTLGDSANLPTGAPDFDAYFIDGHFWVKLNGQWEDFGDLTGPMGPAGPQGVQGPIGATGVGVPGEDGEDGDKITNAEINTTNNHLIITTDKSGSYDAGLVAHTRIRDQLDATLAPTSADNNKAIVYNASTDKFVLGNAGGGGGTFTSLTDAPSSYSGQANKVVAVNNAGTGVTFIDKIDTFLELTDTPAAYTASAGKHVRVNTGLTALEFVDPTFLELKDTPSAYGTNAGKFVRVNTANTGLEFADAPTNFLGLTDTPSTYTGQAGKSVVVNSAGTGLEFGTASGGGSGPVGGTIILQLTSDSKFQMTGNTLPAGWSIAAVMTGGTNITFQAPAGFQMKSVSGWGLGQVPGRWVAWSSNAAVVFSYPDSDPTLILMAVNPLSQAQTGANGKIRIEFF